MVLAPVSAYRGTVPLTREEMRALIAQEKTDAQIAEIVGRSEYAVRNLRLFYGLGSVVEMRRERLARINPPFRIAYPPSRDQMVWWLKAGFHDADIAERYGTSRRRISHIRFNLCLGLDGETVEHAVQEYTYERPLKKCGDMPGWVRFEDFTSRELPISDGVPLGPKPKVMPRNLAERNDPAFRHLVTA